MAVSGLNESTLRPREHLLLWAFGISIALHLIAYADWAFLSRQTLALIPAWLQSPQQKITELQKKQPAPDTEQQVPLLFVDVDPATATKEAPKDAKYYSAHNSQAANTAATIDSTVPKLDGTQTHVAQTQTVPRANPVPLQPAPPKPVAPRDSTSETEAKAKPKAAPPVGDLALAKPTPQPPQIKPETDTGEADTTTHARPRTLAEAKMRQAMLSGEKMQQDGGVKHRVELLDSLDARATPFGEYDRELIDAIRNRWFDLLQRKQFSRDRTGKVVIEFRLDYGGRISNLKVVESDVNELLSYVCQMSIRDPAPFAPWPTDMRKLMGADYRDVRFTFFYE